LKYKNIIILSIFSTAIIALIWIQYQNLKVSLVLTEQKFKQDVGKVVLKIQEDLQNKNELTYLIRSSILKDTTVLKMPKDSLKSASNYFLNDFLASRLIEKGINNQFSFSIYSPDSSILQKSKKQILINNAVNFPIQLNGYLPNECKKSLFLNLKIENKNRNYYLILNKLVIPSFLLILLIFFLALWLFYGLQQKGKVIDITNEFINNLTHEMKTPVFSIGLATKILEGSIEEKDKKFTTIIREQSDRLKHLIDKILQLAQIENKGIKLEKAEFDFAPVLQKIAMETHAICALENINFQFSITDNPCVIFGSETHLQNAVLNIIDNAIKYSKEKNEIFFTVNSENNFLKISVKDSGIGISKENQKKVFDKYFRVSEKDLHTVKGFGLGLNYVKQIVALHKGKIQVHSELGKGTEMVLTIPLKKMKNE